MIFLNYLVAYKKSVLYVAIIYYSNIGKYCLNLNIKDHEVKNSVKEHGDFGNSN